jgi:uncharacterized protein
MAPFPTPTYAYVPGQSPRHPENTFDGIRGSAQVGMSVEDLAGSDAWQAGLQFLRQGYYWEAHEVIEPVWLALPGGPEKRLVQGVIQLANAALKHKMGRPRAVLRLCDLVDEHLKAVSVNEAIRMRVKTADFLAQAADLRKAQNQ